MKKKIDRNTVVNICSNNPVKITRVLNIIDKNLDINQKYIREVSKKPMLKKPMDQIRKLNIFIIRKNLCPWKQH